MVYRVSCAWIGPMDEVELTNMAITIANVLQIRLCPTNLPMFSKSANVLQIRQCFTNTPMFSNLPMFYNTPMFNKYPNFLQIRQCLTNTPMFNKYPNVLIIISHYIKMIIHFHAHPQVIYCICVWTDRVIPI